MAPVRSVWLSLSVLSDKFYPFSDGCFRLEAPSIHVWVHRGTEQLRDLAVVTQLVSGWVESAFTVAGPRVVCRTSEKRCY